jgi:hypothetical protein
LNAIRAKSSLCFAGCEAAVPGVGGGPPRDLDDYIVKCCFHHFTDALHLLSARHGLPVDPDLRNGKVRELAVREQDPFKFFINHASAIEGLGGANLSPDPRYCFHTLYTDVRPGPARYELRLDGVRASYGELALRVHAFRPESGENASLVAGARLDVASDERSDLSIQVRFAALRDVQYAFYGYFVEDSDLHAESLKIVLHEVEGEVVDYVEPPRSVLALGLGPKEVRPANALIHVGKPSLFAPVSQDCTVAQMDAVPGAVAGIEDWSEAMALIALDAYGVAVRALECIVIDPVSEAFGAALAKAGFLVRHADGTDVPPATSMLFADVVVWPAGLPAEPDPARRWDIVQAWLGRLKIGGLGVMTGRYYPDPDAISSARSHDGPLVTRNEIGKWALRLIGEGYSVAPLALSSPKDLVLDYEGLARFALIVRRH